jgi:type I restriction enzyme, S subunit
MTFKESKLVELCEIVSSKRVFAASYQSEGVPFFRGKEISQLARGEKTTAELYISEDVYTDVISRTGPINPGDILLTAVGTLGNPYQVKNADLPFYFKDGNIVWLRKFSNKINSTYLFYWLNSEYGRRKVLDTAIGSTQAALTITGLETISISWPSLAQQTGIVKVLSAIDEKIALNDSLSKSLEDIAQTIFKSWFIDFDPVKAKMAGKNPAGMDAATAALFPDSMEDSELGEIPARWQVASLGSIASIHQGKYLKPSDMSPTRSVEFPNPVEGATKIIGYSTKSTFNFNFSSVSCRGSCGFVRWICSPAWISNNLMAIHGKGEEEINHYLHFLLKSINFESVTTGSVQGQITITNLSSLRVIHNIKLAKRFSEMIEPIHEAISTLERQSAALAEIRDTLMPRLISGELQIPEEMLAS